MKVQCRLDDVYSWQVERTVNDKDFDKHFTTIVQQPDMHRPLTYIGGLDISFVKDDSVNACAAFVVIHMPSLEVI